MENELREEISENELIEFSERVRKLSDEKIDELWRLCGFIISGREEKYKAIRQTDIDRIRESRDSAKKVVWNLIAETSRKDFKKNLARVEK